MGIGFWIIYGNMGISDYFFFIILIFWNGVGFWNCGVILGRLVRGERILGRVDGKIFCLFLVD